MLMKPLSILVYAPISLKGMGGAERHVTNLIQILKLQGHRVTVCSEDNARPLTPLQNVIAGKIPALRSTFFASRHDIAPADYDFVLSFDLSGLGVRHPRHIRVMAGCATAFRQHALSRPQAPARAFVQDRITDAYHVLERRASRGLGNVACSEGLAKEVRRLGLPLLDVIAPPTDIANLVWKAPTRDEACRAWGAPTSKTYLAFAGRWEYAKGCDRLSALAARLPSQYAFLIAGPSKEALPPEVAARTAFSGPVAPDRMNYIYRAAHLVLLPSRFEGASMVIAEALACGVPVLTTPVGSGVDLSQASPLLSSMIIKTPDDIDEWLGAITQFEQPAHYESVSREGARYAELYAIEAVAARWQELLLKTADPA